MVGRRIGKGKLKILAVVIIAILAIAGFVYFGVSMGAFSVGTVSGAEGDQGSALGFQPPGTSTIYSVGSSSMGQSRASDGCTYSWESGSSSEAGGVIRSCSDGSSYMDYSMSTPQTFCGNSEYSGLQINGCTVSSFNYWVDLGNGNKQHVYANVYEDNWTIEFKSDIVSHPFGSSLVDFGNSALWLNNSVNIWDVQSCDPTNQSTCQNGYVWGAPMQGTINSYHDNCKNSNCQNQIIPESEGTALSLYYGVTNTAPSGNSVPYNNQSVQSYIQNGGSPLSPDQSLNRFTQFPEIFNGFGPYWCGFAQLFTCGVGVTFSVTVYFLVIGSFLWTNPNHTPYHSTPPPNGVDPLGNLASLLGNFFNQIFKGFSTFAFNTLLLMAVAAIVIVAVISASLVLIFTRRKRGV